jgi:hypothetical protein
MSPRQVRVRHVLAAVDLAKLPIHFTLSAAGFPTDHKKLRGDGVKLKDLWGSDGQVVDDPDDLATRETTPPPQAVCL